MGINTWTCRQYLGCDEGTLTSYLDRILSMPPIKAAALKAFLTTPPESFGGRLRAPPDGRPTIGASDVEWA